MNVRWVGGRGYRWAGRLSAAGLPFDEVFIVPV